MEERETIRRNWGLDRPLHVQYLVFLGKAVRGDFGNSWKWQGHTAMGLVMDRLPATLELAGAAIAISILLALPIGVLSAVKKDTLFDSVGKVVALLGQSLPSFWLGIILMWVFAVILGWLPTSGRGGISRLILPAVSLGWFQVAVIMRLVRSAMLDVDGQRVRQADAHQGPVRVEGGLEALPAQRGDRAARRISPSTPGC